MSNLFAKQVGLWNDNGTAEFEVRRMGDKLLEGTRVLAKNELEAKAVFHKGLINKILELQNK